MRDASEMRHLTWCCKAEMKYAEAGHYRGADAGSRWI